MKKKIKNWLSEEEDGYKRKKRTLKRKMAKRLKRRKSQKPFPFIYSQPSQICGIWENLKKG